MTEIPLSNEPLVVQGHLIGQQTITLEVPLTTIAAGSRVTIEIRPIATPATEQQSTDSEFDQFVRFVESLPPGTRTREDIDAQIREERESWGD